MTTEARRILSTPLCHVDEPTLRRLLAEAVARVDALEAVMWAVIRMNDTAHPSGNLDAAVAYRQAEREIWETARKLMGERK